MSPSGVIPLQEQTVTRSLAARTRVLTASAALLLAVGALAGCSDHPGQVADMHYTGLDGARHSVVVSEKDVDVVGASSLAAGHNTLIPELIGRLADAGRSDIRVIAGGVIPPQDYALLRDAGVAAIFGPGTNLVHAAAEVLKLLGHNLPPVGETVE